MPEVSYRLRDDVEIVARAQRRRPPIAPCFISSTAGSGRREVTLQQARDGHVAVASGQVGHRWLPACIPCR